MSSRPLRTFAKWLLSHFGLRRLPLIADLPQSYEVGENRRPLRLQAGHFERGLYFFSIRHSSDFPLTGPRLTLAGPGFETEDNVYTFVRRDQREFFGTVVLGEQVDTINFYPSRLPCALRIESCVLRPISEFARDNTFGETYVRLKIFGPGWTRDRLWEEFQEWLKRLLKGGTDDSYATWWQFYGEIGNTGLEHRAEQVRRWLDGPGDAPTVSILLPLSRPSPDFLAEAVSSVREQVYPNWQLCLCDDGSNDPALAERLQAWCQQDERITLVRHDQSLGPGDALASALAAANGDYVGFLGQDDSLTPDALFEVVAAIRANPALKLIYSDEDLVDMGGQPLEPLFKPDWNFDFVRAITFPRHFLVARREAVVDCGGIREGFNGAEDLDLLLRLAERLDRSKIHHLPRVLYHWRTVNGAADLFEEKLPGAWDAGVRALQDHLQRMSLAATAYRAELSMTYRVRWQLPDPAPSVSIVIPTRDNLRVLRNCVETLLERTEYPDYEVLIVDNLSSEPETLAYLEKRAGERVRVIRYPEPFNFSAINNFAIEHSDADVVVLLNNDTEVCNSEWLEELVSQASRPEVGAVGAKLFYAEDRIQHAGVLLGLGPDRVAGHAFKGFHRHEVGPLARTRLAQEYHAVTAACLAVSRHKYLQMGGLDAEHLAVAFNDVDFCLKLADAGYLNIWTPYAQLYHYESYTRGYDVTAEKRARFLTERDVMHRRWEQRLGMDAYYNPNLSRHFDNFSLAWPPAPNAHEEQT